jgi:parallel beta-helix repeat protein
MRLHPSISAVAAAVAVLTATTFQFGATPSADAHGSGFVTKGGHHIKTPPAVKAVPVDNVRDFGAVGNGVIDDTNAIQNAANDAHNRGIGVFFPPGTYLHANAITFNSVPVTGSGTASQLVSNNQNNCAVILTGFNVSIQNMVISTQGLTGSTSLTTPNTATLLVQTATSFTVANNTIVAGTNIWGALVLQSTVGSISSVVFDGTGSLNDQAVVIDQGDNVTVVNSLFQNDSGGVHVLNTGGPSQFIAVLSNTIGNATFPITEFGVNAQNVSVLDVSQNTIQLSNSNGGVAIFLSDTNDFIVSGNDTWGGLSGVEPLGPGAGNNLVTQNTIHNCGFEGIFVSNSATSAIQVTSNQFGECGLLSASPIIFISDGGVPANDASGPTTFVQNNSYQGHLNNLTFYIQCSYTSPHIPAANVTGNTQTQTALSNSI